MLLLYPSTYPAICILAGSHCMERAFTVVGPVGCVNMANFSIFSESIWYLFSVRVSGVTMWTVPYPGWLPQLGIRIHSPFPSLEESTA